MDDGRRTGLGTLGWFLSVWLVLRAKRAQRQSACPRNLRPTARARALAALAADNTARACGSLRGFLNHIAAQQGKKLTAAQAQQLSDSASDLRASLGCDDPGDNDRDDD